MKTHQIQIGTYITLEHGSDEEREIASAKRILTNALADTLEESDLFIIKEAKGEVKKFTVGLKLAILVKTPQLECDYDKMPVPPCNMYTLIGDTIERLRVEKVDERNICCAIKGVKGMIKGHVVISSEALGDTLFYSMKDAKTVRDNDKALLAGKNKKRSYMEHRRICVGEKTNEG